MASRPVLLVVYDAGSAGPARIAEAAQAQRCTLLFALADTPHAQEMASTLEDIGVVVDLDDEQQLREYDASGIVTFSESQLGRTAELAVTLGLGHHPLSSVPAITRKDAQRESLSAAGVDSVRARTIRSPADIDEAIGFVGLPAVVKPVVSASSRNTRALDSSGEARRVIADLLEREPELLIEEQLIGRPVEHPWGDYIAVDCAVDGREVAPVFITSKFALAPPYRERGGYGAPSVLPRHELDELVEVSRRAVRAVGIRRGMAQVELKLTADVPRVIEVNGRLGGWTDDLARRSGTSEPVDIAMASALGRPWARPDVFAEGAITFYYLIVPPEGAARVRAIHEPAALRELPGVEQVVVLTEVGADVAWGLGTQSGVGAVSGRVGSHAELAALVDRIETVAWIEYDGVPA
jgi:biotin carboxylase